MAFGKQRKLNKERHNVFMGYCFNENKGDSK